MSASNNIIQYDNEAVCSVCGSANAEPVLRIENPDRFERACGISSENYIRIWERCGCCSVLANKHTAENRDKIRSIETQYYSIDFDNTTIRDKYNKVMSLSQNESDNWQRVLRIMSFMDSLPAVLDSDGQEFTILDIGAGTGVFLARFLEQAFANGSHWKAVAVEPDDKACEHLRSLGLFDVVASPYAGQKTLRGFRLCTLNKILEHIEYPVDFLASVKDTLSSDNGVLYIEVPDAMTVQYRNPDDNILGALHFHLYTFKSLATLLDAAGLVPLQISRIFEPSGKISLSCFATVSSVVESLARR